MKFVTKELINKGCSKDKKHCVTDENQNSKYGYKKENIYYFDNGKVKEL